MAGNPEISATETRSFTFGPVPSRRLGRSLGVNNIPPKVCSYSCVYCQLGRTARLQIRRETFYPPEVVVQAVREKVGAAVNVGEPIDYLTIVPDGEPTLDVNLGALIAQLRLLGIPVAVITNASLLWLPEVRAALLAADWVSVNVDAAQEPVWHAIDRPHGRLDFAQVQAGIWTFAAEFAGTLVTETMLVRGLNDGPEAVAHIVAYAQTLAPQTCYLAAPTRPPAEPEVLPPTEAALHAAYQQFADAGLPVQYLISYEGDDFAATGEVTSDILNITAVHPMREDALRALVAKAGTEWGVVQALVAQGRLLVLSYAGHRHYVRQLPGVQRRVG